MLKQKYFLTGIFILSAERQPIKLAWRKIVWLQLIDKTIVYMKKLLFFSILMMAVLSVNYSLKEPRVNTLLLDNIEALAADEQDVPTNCWGSGSVDCPVTKVKVEYVATGYSLEK